MDELRIGEPFSADCRVDALDPQRAEAALFDLAIAVRILASLFDRLPRNADGILAATTIAGGLFEDPLVLGAGGDTPLTLAIVQYSEFVMPRHGRGSWFNPARKEPTS